VEADTTNPPLWTGTGGVEVCRVVGALAQAAEPSAALLEPDDVVAEEAAGLAVSVDLLDELEDSEAESDLPAGTDADDPLRESVR
jgi:hypothetical protein